jgi:hypothetical protein
MQLVVVAWPPSHLRCFPNLGSLVMLEQNLQQLLHILPSPRWSHYWEADAYPAQLSEMFPVFCGPTGTKLPSGLTCDQGRLKMMSASEKMLKKSSSGEK